MVPVSHYSSRQHLWCACQGIGGERVMFFPLFRSHRSIFKGLVKEDKEESVALTLSGGASSMHARKLGARAGRRFCFAPMAVIYFLSGGRG